MAIQLSVATRNAMLDAIETAIGAQASAKLAISGAASSIIEITGAGAIELVRPFSPVDGRALEAQPRAGITATTGARLLSSVPKGDGLIARPGHRHISAAPTKRAA